MPYYCTVPRCTSMAGKAKNVSFHQFPKDEILAEKWNLILKRGKPYTKYSKVCSLHFTSNDYSIATNCKTRGNWRTLRKDAIPSQNLPSDDPPAPRRRSSRNEQDITENQIQHQLAQAMYMQTLMAVHAANLAVVSAAAASEAASNDSSDEIDGSELEVPQSILNLSRSAPDNGHTDEQTSAQDTYLESSEKTLAIDKVSLGKIYDFDRKFKRSELENRIRVKSFANIIDS